MTTRKAIALAGLVLALAILSPASALAKAGGTDRPLKGIISGTVSLNTLTGSFTGDATGVASHLGEFTAHQEGTVGPTPEGIRGSSTWTIVADNGDKVTGTATLKVEGLPSAAHTTTQFSTITGGTGRFADATGKFTTIYHVTPGSFDGVTLRNSSEGTTTGQISY